MAAEDAADPGRPLTHLRRAPTSPPRWLPGVGRAAAMARTAALASAFRVLVPAHFCCSALLGMNRSSRGDGVTFSWERPGHVVILGCIRSAQPRGPSCSRPNAVAGPLLGSPF